MSRPAGGVVEASLEPYRRRFAALQRAADVVREALREAILDGELASGARLREEDLAREFGVSRTPIREALQQLSAEGLVEINPHQGAVVSQLTVEDILSIYVVREALEGVAARLAARRATERQCEQLIALVAEMATLADTATPAQLAENNLRFHAELRRAANNRHLERFLAQVEHSIRRFGNTTFTYPGRVHSTIREHRAIVEAVVARDPERAEALAIEHMRTARQIRLQMLSDEH